MSEPSTLPHQYCPNCGFEQIDLTPILQTAAPKPGSICICYGCYASLKLDQDLYARMMTKADLAALKPPELIVMLQAIKSVRDFKRERRRRWAAESRSVTITPEVQ